MTRPAETINRTREPGRERRAPRVRHRRSDAPFGPAAGSRLAEAFEAERVAGHGPLWFAIAMAIGAAHYATADREIGWIAITALAAITLALAVAVRARPWLHVAAIAGVALALGLGAAKREAERVGTAIMVGEATTRVTGTVEWISVDARGRTRYDLLVERTAEPTLQYPPSRIRLFVSARHDAAPVGGRIEALARLRQPSGPARPGGYDFAFHNYFDGMGAQGFALGAPRRLADDPDGARSLARLRAGVYNTVRARLPAAEGGVAAALLMGERRGIPDELADALRATGLAHMLAISGLHMALVAGFVLGITRLLLVMPAGVAERISTRKVAALAALVAATAYLFLSGVGVAAQRAWIMLAIMLVAVLFDRPALTLRNVGLAGVAIIATTPHAVVGPGFQMSFAATAALVAAYGHWRRARTPATDPWLTGPMRTVLLFMGGLAVTSTIAGLATAPFAAYHFQRVAPLGLLANLLAMPLVSVVVIPSGLLAVLVMPFGLEAPFLSVMGWGLDLVARVATWVAGLRAPLEIGAVPSGTLLLTTAALVLAVAFRTRLAALALVPLLAAVAMPSRDPPSLLVSERARSVSVIEEGRRIVLPPRGEGFERRQWRDAFGPPSTSSEGFCEGAICRTEANGFAVAWTDDYEAVGEACRAADVVVVARRIKRTRCPNGGWIVHARRTNETGSVEIDLATLDGVAPASAVGRSRLSSLSDAELAAATTPALPTGQRPWTAHRYRQLKPRGHAASGRPPNSR